ncbi:hypothetical protein M9458_027941, partial [Cirrhinus mrigala]
MVVFSLRLLLQEPQERARGSPLPVPRARNGHRASGHPPGQHPDFGPSSEKGTDLLRVRNTGPRDVMAGKRKPTKEKMTPEQELEKCIQDFRRIKIPERFPERKYMW